MSQDTITVEQEIRDNYLRMGTLPAQPTAFSNGRRWQANSQYGYCLSEHESRIDAERAVVTYYTDRMNLIRQ